MSSLVEKNSESVKSDKETSQYGDCESPESATNPLNQSVALKKEIGLLNGVAIILGIIVGSGIFLTPKGVLQDAGSIGLSLFVWVSCGILATIGATCYAELGTSVPKSGGDYAYIKEAFGPLPAFLFLWVAMFIIMPAGNAIAAITFANYLLQPLYDCSPPDNAVRLIAASAICFLTFVNCYNVKWATRVQDAFTISKIIALIIIIITGAVHLISGKTQNLSKIWDNTATDPGKIAASFYSGLFSYAGWNYLNFVTEELKDPFRNLPRAIYISLPFVTIIYILANLAYFVVLTPDEVLATDAIAVTFGDKTLGYFKWSMPFFVALSTFGGLNGGIFASARLFFVGARYGHMPSFVAMVNIRYYTPVNSLIFLGLLTLLYLTTTKVYSLITYASFIESLFTTLSVAALIWLRYKQPELHRPIKVNMVWPIVFFVVCLFLVLLPTYTKPVETGIAALITLMGVPVYMVTIYWQNKPRIYKSFIVVGQGYAQTCHLRELDLCAATLLVFTQNPSGGIGTNDAELNKQCGYLKEADSCLRNFTRKCTTPLQRELISFVSEGGNRLLTEYCTPGTQLRQSYLKHANCLSQATKGQKGCVKDLQSALEIVTSVEWDRRIPAGCCAYRRFQGCTESLVETKCGKEAVEFINILLRMAASRLPDIICQGYGPQTNECTSLLPAPGTLPKGARSSSVLSRLFSVYTGL